MKYQHLPIESAGLPVVVRKKRRRKRIRRSASNLVAEAIGDLDHEHDVVVLSNGQFSLIDVVEHCLNNTGPADVCIAMWSTASVDIGRLKSFETMGMSTSTRIIIDPSFFSRKTANTNALLQTFDNSQLRTIPSHAKFATLINSNWSVVIRTSMNLNQNKRMEYLELGHDPELAEALQGLIFDIFERSSGLNFIERSNDTLDSLFANFSDPDLFFL